MSDTTATLISLDDIARPAEDGPSPVPPVLKASVAKASASKPAAKKPVIAAKAAPIELQPQPEPQSQPQPHIVTEQAAEPATRSTKEPKMVETIQMITDKTKTAFAEANERAKAQMEKGAQSFQDLGAFNKGNLEAIVESSKIAATGMQKLGQDAAVYAKSSYENATSAFKSMTSVKSPTELFKLQSDFARASFDAFVAEASRSTEAALKLAGEIAQPISNRVALAAEKIKVAA
jgi:phasin family protein